MNPLREAARVLYELRATRGWDALQSALEVYDEDELEVLTSCWQFMAHDYQLRPEGVTKWMIMAGRGAGKNRAGAEDTLDLMEDWGPKYCGLLISKSTGDIRDFMIGGESGLRACAARRGYHVSYVQNTRTVKHPSGAVAMVISSDTQEGIRGPNFNHVWADEIAKWNDALYTWLNIEATIRSKQAGRRNMWTITTTPKRNSAVIAYLMRKFEAHVTHATSRDNFDNLSEDFQLTVARNEGTTWGREEYEGEFLEGNKATISQDIIHENRVRRVKDLSRIIVSFDPAIEDKDDSDDHGIVTIGIDKRDPADAYVLDDQTLQATAPEEAAMKVVKEALRWDAAAIVVEINQGGKWITSHLRIAMETLSKAIAKETGKSTEIVIPVVPVWATQAKEIRADPVGALYERGRIHHVGVFRALEKELTEWMPGMRSPNRLDALVHGVSHLLLNEPAKVGPIESYLR